MNCCFSDGERRQKSIRISVHDNVAIESAPLVMFTVDITFIIKYFVILLNSPTDLYLKIVRGGVL